VGIRKEVKKALKVLCKVDVVISTSAVAAYTGKSAAACDVCLRALYRDGYVTPVSGGYALRLAGWAPATLLKCEEEHLSRVPEDGCVNSHRHPGKDLIMLLKVYRELTRSPAPHKVG